jgi:spore maturation protein CgeB
VRGASKATDFHLHEQDNGERREQSMRIVIFGLTVSSSWGNGHATIWRGLCAALARQGHQVAFFEKDEPYYASHRDMPEGEGYCLVLYTDWGQVEARAREWVGRADAAMVTSYCPDAQAASDLILAAPVPIKAFYDLDTPVTLERWRTDGKVGYLPSYGLEPFDLVLSYAGGRTLEELKTLLGARRVAPLYGSVDPEVHKPTRSDSRYQSDLSYLGTYAPDRQAALDQFFLQPARRLPGKRFVIGGALYPDDFPWTENIYFVRHVAPGRHPAFYSSSKLTLSVTRSAMVNTGYCPSGRLFEAAACETPVVSDEWEGLSEFFEPGREILVARTGDDVAALIALDPRELKRIGQAARERILAEHTAERRSRQMVQLLQEAA